MTLRRINSTLWITVRGTRLHWCILHLLITIQVMMRGSLILNEKTALIDTRLNDNPKKYKELLRKCRALVRGAVQLEKKERLTWNI